MRKLFKFQGKDIKTHISDNHKRKINGVFYHIYGNGPPILFIHGMLMDHKRHKIFAHDLVNQGFQVIMIDLPSHGNSKISAFSKNTLIELLKSLITELGYKTYFGVGISLGAGIISELAISDNRLKKCATIFPIVSKGDSLKFVSTCALNSAKARHISPRKFIETIFRTNTSPKYPEEKIQKRVDEIFHQSWKGTLSGFLWASQINIKKNLKKLGDNCLVIAGKYDKLARKESILKIHKNAIILNSNHSDLTPLQLIQNKKHIITEFFKNTLID